MMAEHRVVILKEAQNLKNFEALDKYLENPVKSTILCVCYKNGTLKSPKTLLTKVAQTGVLLESKKMKDYQLAGFIEKYLKVRNTTIEPKATDDCRSHRPRLAPSYLRAGQGTPFRCRKTTGE